jgi:hypothetical protein
VLSARNAAVALKTVRFIMSPIPRPAPGRSNAKAISASRARLARRLQIELGILWPVFGMLSAIYVGLFGRVFGVW